MALQLNAGDIKDPFNPQGGGDRPKPGHGLVVIKEFNEYGGASGKAHEMVCEIVAWTDEESVTMFHKENIFHADNTGKGFPTKRLNCIAMAAGLYNAKDAAAAKEAGTELEFDGEKLIGRPVFMQLVEVPDQNDKTRSYINVGGIGLAIYHIMDPRCSDWPTIQGIINRAAAAVGEWVAKEGAVKPAPTEASKGNPFAKNA